MPHPSRWHGGSSASVFPFGELEKGIQYLAVSGYVEIFNAE